LIGGADAGFHADGGEQQLMRGIDRSGVFITGGCGDIGLAVAQRFLQAGARVVLADLLSAQKGRALIKKKLDSPNAAFVSCDVTRAGSIDAALAAALKFLGRLDTVICNAGIALNEPFLTATEKAWAATLAVNLTGSFLTAQRAARIMRKNRRRANGRRGTILFTGSWVQDMPWPNGTSYCTSKAGQQMLAKVMAQELAPEGIGVSLVAPGIVYAGLTKRIYDQNKKFAKLVDRTVPAGRMCSAEEVAGSFLFLAGDDGAYVTGATLLIDGGATLVRRN
jgi:NAD(P)-dependent dehydrogenase (short-subunit alcohol dehydrogenase family)